MIGSNHLVALSLLALVASGAEGPLYAQNAPDDARDDATQGATATVSGPATIGQPHPPLELEVTDGSLVNHARMAGRPFVVAAFATWCQPCHHALADLLLARAATGGNSISLVLMNRGESPEVVSRWIKHAALPVDLLVTVDPAGIASRRWGVRRLPTIFVVDATGVVRHINRGWGPGYQARVSRWLRGITAAGSPPGPRPAP